MLTILDFSAAWCAPCRAMEPVIDRISKKYEDICVQKIDVDLASNAARDYNITSVPTFLFLIDGKVVDKVVGATSEATLEYKINTLK